MNIIKILDKECARTLAWVNSATSKNGPNAALIGIKIEKERIAGANGFVLHTAPTPPELQKFAGKTLQFDKTPVSKNVLLEYTENEKEYPNIDAITPVDAPLASFRINPAFLVNAIADPKKPSVYIDVHPSMLVIKQGKYTAQVMLMVKRD